MIFDDVFYPDNPKRRQEVANLRGEIIASFGNYKSAWNDNAKLLNDIFRDCAKKTPFEGVVILCLEKDITKDTVGDCLNEMTAVITDTRTKLKKLVDDIGLSAELPKDWDTKGINIGDLGDDVLLKIGKAITAVFGAVGAGFLGYCVFCGVSFAITWGSIVAGAISSIGAILGGVLSGMVAGGIAFLVTDMIASAITGAIERKELNDAIDALTKLKEAVVGPLADATRRIAGITQSIKDGNYQLSNDYYLQKHDGVYYICHWENGAIVRKELMAAA